jgi:quinol monooxygenase YgiN
VIDLIVVLKARDSASVPVLRELMQTLCGLSLAEPGCLRYELYEASNHPDTFVLIERWESQDALETHRKAEGFVTIYAPKVLPLVDRVPYFLGSL